MTGTNGPLYNTDQYSTDYTITKYILQHLKFFVESQKLCQHLADTMYRGNNKKIQLLDCIHNYDNLASYGPFWMGTGDGNNVVRLPVIMFETLMSHSYPIS